MAKIKSSYFCQSCGYQSAKWLGKCPSCASWNSFVEEVIEKPTSNVPDWRPSNSTTLKKAAKPIVIEDIKAAEMPRLITPDEEFNRVLGGGIVPGSLTLIGGEPGIGKSTLMLQLALQVKGLKTLYVSGEESDQQIKLRAERMKQASGGNQCYILTETSTQNIFKQIEELEPQLVIIDSIQTLHSAHIESTPGSVSQIKECTAELLRFAKESNTPVILIGHITKDGAIAGPKVLEHMVDTVLQFEGDQHYAYRMVRSVKNRFGSTAELGIYEMNSNGLRQVSNPSEILLSHRDEPISGIAVSVMLEGVRPLLVETQALVSTAAYGTPQRSATGFDLRRLNMLLAVIEKRCGFRLSLKDVFLNIAGGIRIEDPAIDLGVICAILSSYNDLPIHYKTCFAAEVGLTGEIRAVNRIEQRISEAEKLGFDELFISKYNVKGLNTAKLGIKIHAVTRLEEVFERIFG